jgi:nucleotide-binding universal stress UspA family protein
LLIIVYNIKDNKSFSLRKKFDMKKVLIALDYDPPAQKIAESGFELAKAMGAQVILLHVVAEPVYYSSLNYSPIMGYDGFSNLDVVQVATEAEMKKAAGEYLEKSKEHLGDSSIQTIVKEGDFAKSILSSASELGADIIVMGSHGRRGLDKILLGSVAEQVLHKSDLPLYIIPTRSI